MHAQIIAGTSEIALVAQIKGVYLPTQMPPATENRDIDRIICDIGERVQQIARLARVVSCAETETHSFQPSMLQFIGAPNVDSVQTMLLGKIILEKFDVCAN